MFKKIQSKITGSLNVKKKTNFSSQVKNLAILIMQQVGDVEFDSVDEF